jgi:hypothetical protein
MEVEITEAQVNDFLYLMFEAQVKDKGKPVKREDVIHRILPGAPRQFDGLVEKAQVRLAEEYGMQVAELPVQAALDLAGLSAHQRRILSKHDPRKVSSRTHLYVLLEKPGGKAVERLDLREEEEEEEGDGREESEEERKRILGLLFVTLGIIHLKDKVLPLPELVAIFKQAFGPVLGYEALVRDVWKRQKYLCLTPIPKSAANDMDNDSSAAGPLVSWGPRALLEFPLPQVFRCLSELFPADKHELIKQSVL